MESFVQWRKGRTPRQAHRDLDGLKDDELGRSGFTGRHAQLYRRHDPTAFRPEGPLGPSAVMADDLHPTDETDDRGEPVVLFANEDCRFLLSRRAAPMPCFVRNLAGDELHFVHRGRGHFETEFGPIPYEPGDWVLLPKAVTYRQVPDEPGGVALIIEAVNEFRVPPAGVLGRHHPFDSSLVYVPEPEVLTAGGPEWEVRLVAGDVRSSIFYDHNPCDVEGWKGDYFPFKFNIRDYDVLTSAQVHLPATAHLFLQATGLVVLNFLPRPAESVPGVERLPYYHRNADYDEVALFHDGSMFGAPMPPGLITHFPQGLHHGPTERMRERSRRVAGEYDRVEWSIVSIDVRRPLTVQPPVRP